MADESKAKSKSPKKAIEVPTTDTSQHADKATRRFIFYMVGVSVLVILIGGGVIYWLGGMYVNQSNKNKAQDIEINLLQTKQKNLALLKPNYEKMIAKGANGSSDADLILRALPTDKAYNELVAMIEKMAQQSGVKVTSATQTQAAGTSNSTNTSNGNSKIPIPFTFSINLEGSYSSLLDFLQKTENSSRVINFVAMNISGTTTGGTTQATMTMQTFYQLPANIAPTTIKLNEAPK